MYSLSSYLKYKALKIKRKYLESKEEETFSNQQLRRHCLFNTTRQNTLLMENVRPKRLWWCPIFPCSKQWSVCWMEDILYPVTLCMVYKEHHGNFYIVPLLTELVIILISSLITACPMLQPVHVVCPIQTIFSPPCWLIFFIRYDTHNKETEFWTAARRQYGVIAIVNMVTFLFGASQPTASISLPRLPLHNDSNVANGTTWPRDFAVTSEEGEWISKCRRLLHSLWFTWNKP